MQSVNGTALFEGECVSTDSCHYYVEIDSVTESEWSELMERFDDANIYQTWAYGTVRWKQKNLSHMILKRADQVVAMAQLRIMQPAGMRIGVAYLRWGPMCHLRGQELNLGTVARILDALRKEYVLKRGLHLEILPNVFEGSQRARVLQVALDKFHTKPPLSRETYRTFILDLSLQLDDLRRNLDPKWRNKLNGAEKNGLRIVDAETVGGYQSFRKIYAELLARKKFHSGVDVDQFANIQRRLPISQRMLVLLCLQGSEPVAGIVCSALGDSAIYLMGATSDSGLRLKGAYLLQWAVIKSLQDQGIRYYDLGGIDPDSNPGVYSFKRGLSGSCLSHIHPIGICDNPFSTSVVGAGRVLQNSLLNLHKGFSVLSRKARTSSRTINNDEK